METKLLNYSKTPIPVLVSSPSPSYEIMQSLLSTAPFSQPPPPHPPHPPPLASSYMIDSSPHRSSSLLDKKHSSKQPTTTTTTTSTSAAASSSTTSRASAALTKKQEKTFIRNTINLINNHSSRTIAKDLVLSAARKQKHAAANKRLASQEHSHLGLI